MKNLFLTIAISFTFSFIAQNREINFEHGNLASVLEKAKKENKLIFVDAYTTWCGPCKWMAKNVFTNDTVADYFNKTFVNYKLDMEKGEGIDFAKKYEVGCYPTLLYIDGTGNLVHRTAGAGNVSQLIVEGKNSQTDKAFTARKNKFEKEGINDSNINEYAALMSWNCMDAVKPVTEYFKTVKNEDLIKRNNWTLTRDYIESPASREIKHLITNRATYERNFGKDTVERKLNSVGMHYFDKFIYDPNKFNKEEFEKTKETFISLNLPDEKKILYWAELTVSRTQDPPKYYSMAAADYLKYYNDDANALNSMAWNFYENVNDKDQLKAAVNMAKRASDLSPDYATLDTYAAVLYKSGNYSEADKMATLSIEKAKAAKLGTEDYKDTIELQKKIREKLNSK